MSCLSLFIHLQLKSNTTQNFLNSSWKPMISCYWQIPYEIPYRFAQHCWSTRCVLIRPSINKVKIYYVPNKGEYIRHLNMSLVYWNAPLNESWDSTSSSCICWFFLELEYSLIFRHLSCGLPVTSRQSCLYVLHMRKPTGLWPCSPFWLAFTTTIGFGRDAISPNRHRAYGQSRYRISIW